MTNEALLDPALCRELGHVRKQLLPPAAASSSVILSSLEFVKFLIMAESQLNSKSYYYTQCTILLLRYPADTHTNTHTEKSITLLLMSSTVRHVLTHIRKIPPIPLRKFHII